MERNLKNLQERMQQQSIEDESIPKFGGSRWKSARPDKGSVTSYAKSVQDKHRKKSNGEDPALLKTQSAPRLVPQKEKPPVDFRSKGTLAESSTGEFSNVLLIHLHSKKKSRVFKMLITMHVVYFQRKISNNGVYRMFSNGFHLLNLANTPVPFEQTKSPVRYYWI